MTVVTKAEIKMVRPINNDEIVDVNEEEDSGDAEAGGDLDAKK